MLIVPSLRHDQMIQKLVALATSTILMASCSIDPPPPKPHLSTGHIDRKAAVTIVKKPAYIQHGTFVEYQNTHSTRGITEWMFHCYPDLKYNEIERSLLTNKTKVVIEVTKITLTIALPITIRLGQLASKKSVDHENGHVEIITQIYEKAQEAAREACEPIIGMRFEGEGANVEDAIASAVDKASQLACSNYKEKTVVIGNKLSQKYDEITRHGEEKISVPDAVKKSYELNMPKPSGH
jgi:hypothetical protein